jgi:nucleoside-diphosphate-sugar epimerase
LTGRGHGELDRRDQVLVTGAGGFIGGHLVAELRRRGFERVRGADIKPLADWYQLPHGVENLVLDLREAAACAEAVAGADVVFNLAADMGGMGYIETHKAECMVSVLINTNLLIASRVAGVRAFLFGSSACVYAAEHQTDPAVTALKEEDAYPADPEDGYGWEKLFSERMCRHFHEDYGIDVRVPRFHNVFGPNGTWDGGREKAPAAICRKVVAAQLAGSNTIEIWGDGEQTRSFTYIDDTIDGIFRLMASDVSEPINLGSSQLVTINRLVEIVEEIAGITLERRYDLSAPQGVRGRNSDNTMILERLGWEPSTSLEAGMATTYAWIREQMTLGVEDTPLVTAGNLSARSV